MSHPVLDASLKRRRVPLRLRAATLRELVEASLSVRVQDVVSPPVVLGKGGTETLAEWKFLLDHALHDTVQCWLRRRCGWDPGDGLPPISHVAWAVDLFWFSPCFAQFASMCQDLTEALEDAQLSWKPPSLLFMPNRVAAQDLPETWCSFFPVLSRSGEPIWFHRSDALPCLGVLLPPTGDTATAVDHRMSAGMHHYHARSYQPMCRGIPKRARLDRHYQTVGSTTLWGFGGWTFSKCLVALLESQELLFLHRILQVLRLPGEGFVGYVKRSASVCRQVLVKYKLQGIVATALTRLHGWAGHLARLPPSSPVVRVLWFRSLAWWREQQERGNRRDSRHHRPGRFARWEAPLELFDPECFTLAQDRSAWRLSRSCFVLGELLRLGARNAFGFGGRSTNALFPPFGGGPPSDLTVPWPPTSLLGNLASVGDRVTYLCLGVPPPVWRSAGYLGVLPWPAPFCTAYHNRSSEIHGPPGPGLASPAHTPLRCGR